MRLRELRKRRGLSLAKVAEYLGISAMQMSRIERGIDSLKVAYAKKLGQLYEVPWDEFYSESENF